MTDRKYKATMRRLERSKPCARASTVVYLILMGVCIHKGNAFCPSSQKVKLTPMLNMGHQSPFLLDQHRPLSTKRPTKTSIYSSVSPNAGSSNDTPQSPRSKLRQLTGFSLTALRTTLRAATGISLSQSISGALRITLGILSPSLRYFLQPLLIMYYAPLLMIRYWMVGPSQKYVEESRKGHERMVEGWRKAVEAAESANSGGYWPVHLNDDGTITTSLPPDPNDVLDLADGIEKSVAATTTTAETTVP